MLEFSLNEPLLISNIPQWVISFFQQPLPVSFSEIVGSVKLRKRQHRNKTWRNRGEEGHHHISPLPDHVLIIFFFIFLHFCIIPTVLSKSLEQTSENEVYLHKNENSCHNEDCMWPHSERVVRGNSEIACLQQIIISEDTWQLWKLSTSQNRKTRLHVSQNK